MSKRAIACLLSSEPCPCYIPHLVIDDHWGSRTVQPRSLFEINTETFAFDTQKCFEDAAALHSTAEVLLSSEALRPRILESLRAACRGFRQMCDDHEVYQMEDLFLSGAKLRYRHCVAIAIRTWMHSVAYKISWGAPKGGSITGADLRHKYRCAVATRIWMHSVACQISIFLLPQKQT